MPMVTRLAEKTSQLKPTFAPSATSISPFLHDRMLFLPTKTPLPIVMPRLPSPFASIRQLSSITTLSPIRILWGCLSTTFWPKMTFRPQAPRSDGKSALRNASPTAPGTFWENSCTSS